MKKIVVFCIAILFCTSSIVSGQITLPAFFSDGMVLQQKTNAPIWGWAAPGEEITVAGSWNKDTLITRANDYGEWMVKVSTPEAGGPYQLTVEGSKTIVVNNVLIGEVWLASGQSNMEMPVAGWPGNPILNSKEMIAQADYPQIRLFNVKNMVAIKPQKNVEGSWSAVSPKTVAGFSAAAYFFGLQLYKKLQVPIGLISSEWGGTMAEAWTSEGGLRPLGDFDSALNRLDEIRPSIQWARKADKQRQEDWQKRLKQVRTDFAEKALNDSQWKNIKVPSIWEEEGYPGVDGIAWYRKNVYIPEDWAGDSLVLNLGPIDDNDMTWFNGQKVGATNGFLYNRRYVIPGEIVEAGNNLIAVRIRDTGGDGGMNGKPKELRLFPAHRAGVDTISLAGKWKFNIAARKKPMLVPNSPNTPSVLFNGMIAPLIPYAIRGVIWYQGESNVGRAKQYTRLFPAMIKDWRRLWNQGEFPFYFVQIAPFPYWGIGEQGARLRDAQRQTLNVPNTGMVVTMDIGDTTIIHPANKEAVGKRLSLWALAQVYGKHNLVYSGPLYKSMSVEGNKAILSFSHVDGGLMTKRGGLRGFEIAGSDGVFVPAQAQISGTHVIVSAASVKHPKAVRYGWTDTAQAYLFNKSGLPASSFSTRNPTLP